MAALHRISLSKLIFRRRYEICIMHVRSAAGRHLAASMLRRRWPRSFFSSYSARQPILLSIEGNVGAGKSTLIEELKRRHTEWTFISEPVDIWSAIKDDEGKSLLSVYYDDPKRWSYSFQSCALLSRFENIERGVASLHENCSAATDLKSESTLRHVVVTERCLDTDYYVFAKMLHDRGLMDKLEFDIYQRLYLHLQTSMKVSLSAIVYVDTSPEQCLENVKKRNRTGESDITLDYLKSVDKYQSEWMNNLSDISILKTDYLNSRNYISEIDAFVNRQLVSSRDQKFYNVCL